MRELAMLWPAFVRMAAVRNFGLLVDYDQKTNPIDISVDLVAAAHSRDLKRWLWTHDGAREILQEWVDVSSAIELTEAEKQTTQPELIKTTCMREAGPHHQQALVHLDQVEMQRRRALTRLDEKCVSLRASLEEKKNKEWEAEMKVVRMRAKFRRRGLIGLARWGIDKGTQVGNQDEEVVPAQGSSYSRFPP